MARPKRKKAARRPRKSAKKWRTPELARLPKDATTLLVVLRAKEGQGALLEAELRALVGPTRREEGCLRYELYRAADQPGAFLLHEVWASREHHKLHTQTSHFLRWDARKEALVASRDAGFWKQTA